MRTLRTIAEVRAHVAAAPRAGRSVGLVPTMGAFHAGHEALMRAARERCDEVSSRCSSTRRSSTRPPTSRVPAHGGERRRDRRASSASTCCSRPPPRRSTRDGFATTVRVDGLADVLEGAERGARHFDGVCTVVCKLFTIVAPDVAFFGQKDAQQVVVIRRMVRDLDLPVRLAVVPTVRDPDGLALSSRNARLGPADRERALALHRGLEAARDASRRGERDPAARRGRRPRRDGRAASSPTTSPSWTRHARSGASGSTAGYSSPWRPASGRHG